MIILYEEDEVRFESLGIGTLKDTLSAEVTEGLNDSFELELTYPVSGKFFNELKIDRIICCKTNPYDSYQPFRIYSITKPIDGTVTINANHISYDMNGIPVTALSGNNLNEIINKIQNGWDEVVSKSDEETETVHKKCVLLDNPFKFNTDIFSAKTFKTTAPYNLRAILMGGDESLVAVYDGELQFDKCNVSILKRRGYDRGAKVVYGHNMTDLNHEIMSENLYNGVFPYYHSEKTTNETNTNDEFKQVYIVGTKTFGSDWLSYTDAGESFIPVAEAPVQIATEGEYFKKIYAWNESNQRYEEKIYNEQVNLIQGVFEPTWITIDWSKFPIVTCRANKVGYFKKSTDTNWGDKKGVGDEIFSESLISGGIMQNILLCFSEVIPSDSTSTNKEVSEIIDVILDDPIIKIETQDTRNMLHNRILNLNLSSEFDEAPTKDQLKRKAEEYINKNKIGIVKHNTKVSFIDLASTTEHDKYQNFDHVELGDTVEVLYKDLDVDIKLRVISISYNVLLDQYTSIELGEKEDKMSSQTIQTGDNVSSLSNDVGYADITTVNKLIAQTVTAEFIEATNARLSKASIKQLEVERINATGIIEAAQFSLDTLVAKLLTADNAEIKNKLKAGEIEVAGDITVKSGEISIESQNGNTSFKVDREGNVTGNSMTITGGNFDIGNGNFTVTNDGTMYAKDAEIEGSITATTGKIGDFYIIKKIITTDKDYDADDPGSYTPKDSDIYITPDFIKAGKNFSVDKDGTIKTSKGTIGPLSIEDSSSYGQKKLVYTNSSGKTIFEIDPSKSYDYAVVPQVAIKAQSILADIYAGPTYNPDTSFCYYVDKDGLYIKHDATSFKKTNHTRLSQFAFENIPIIIDYDYYYEKFGTGISDYGENNYKIVKYHIPAHSSYFTNWDDTGCLELKGPRLAFFTNKIICAFATCVSNSKPENKGTWQNIFVSYDSFNNNIRNGSVYVCLTERDNTDYIDLILIGY